MTLLERMESAVVLGKVSGFDMGLLTYWIENWDKFNAFQQEALVWAAEIRAKRGTT